MNTIVARARQHFIAAHPQWWMGLMLLALHAALAWGIEDWLPRAFLLVHFGLFLIWQPVWRGERDIEPRYAFLVFIVGFLLSGWSNWWLIAVWLAVLIGLIGGGVPGIADRRQRLVSVLAVLYLLSMLLIWVVPQLFPDNISISAVVNLVRFGLPLFALPILLIRVEVGRSVAPIAVDLFYSIILFLLVVALVLGSVVIKQVSHGTYAIALTQMLFVTALLLVALSWLWNPHSGFAGIGHLLSRYLMSLGLPFERWIQRLAELAERESSPPRFLSLALQHMLELPWVKGVDWETRGDKGEFGTRSGHFSEFPFEDLKLKIYTRWPLSPSLLLHLKLLAQMVWHFYVAKRREQTQRQNAYTQAIHETGARLTHDVKNLLQSLNSLCAAADASDPEQAPALQALMQRQLPQITRRLNTTLDKLRAPQQLDQGKVGAASWWEGLTQRYAGRNIEFEMTGAANNVELPSELFDSVAANLIENALRKSGDTAGLNVVVTFSPANGGMLTVCDNGAPVNKNVVSQLFEAPVPSQSGLGIGLLQAAKQAERHGYCLKLGTNQPGHVCFVLARMFHE